MTLVTIASFTYAHDAHMLRTFLESEGISVSIADEETVAVNWLWSNAIGGVKVQIDEVDLEKAREILKQFQKESSKKKKGNEDREICPSCSSRKTDYVVLGRKGAFVMWLIFYLPLFFVRKRMKCEECGHIWKSNMKS